MVITHFQVEQNLEKLDFSIFVLIRGDITTRIFNAWKAQVNQFQAENLTFENKFKYNEKSLKNIVVLSKGINKDIILNWLGNWHHDVVFVNANWIIDSIKARGFLPLDNYIDQIYYNMFLSSPYAISSEENKNSQFGISISERDSLECNEINNPRKRKINDIAEMKKNFVCEQSGSIVMNNYNSKITDKLELLQEIYDLLGDEWRSQGYKKCISILKRLEFEVKSIGDLKKIRGFGKSILEKIDEILRTGSLLKLKNYQSDPKINSIIELSKVWGVGEKTALNLYKQGFHSVQSLRENGMNLLTPQQQIGLNRYEDLLIKIPRSEIALIAKEIRSSIHEIDQNVLLEVCGSYRRGKSECGDIDILLTPLDNRESLEPDFLPRLIRNMENQGFLTDHLALPLEYNDSIKRNTNSPKKDIDDDTEPSSENDYEVPLDSPKKKISKFSNIRRQRYSYMGICKLQGENHLYRRVDIKVYPKSMFPFAVLYFTGSDHFNRSMRLYARKLGFTLSDKGLLSCSRDNFNNKLSLGESIKCRSEKDIFEALHLTYKEPHQRNCFNLD